MAVPPVKLSGPPTKQYPKLPKQFPVLGPDGKPVESNRPPRDLGDRMLGGWRVGVLVCSPLASYLLSLRPAFLTADDLAFGYGLTIEAGLGALRGAPPCVVMVDQLTASSARSMVDEWLLKLPHVPFIMFGEAMPKEGAAMSKEIGMRAYFKRPVAGINFVAKVRQCLLLYR